MIDFKKVERIATALEKQLGIDEPGNKRVRKAEEVEKKPIFEKIDDRTYEEKDKAGVDPNPHNESPLQADDEGEADDIEKEISDAENVIDKVDKANPENPANIEQTMDRGANDESEEITPDEAKACIASLQRLIRIAKAVKMSKDMPATKKEEVLGKIQKASAKFRKAVAQKEESDGDAQDASDHPAVQTFISIFSQKRGKLNSIMKGRGQGAKRIRSLLGDGIDNKLVGNMTLTELFNAMSNVLSKLK